jgi:hypothetical protein
LFGEHIKFCHTASAQDDVQYDFLQQPEMIDSQLGGASFDMKYDGYQALAIAEAAEAEKHDVDGGWLKREVTKHYGNSESSGMSINDMCSSIFDLLASSKSDDALQTDVSTSPLMLKCCIHLIF